MGITVKLWFNRRFPHRRVCLQPGCWRGQENQHRCPRHQHDALRRDWEESITPRQWHSGIDPDWSDGWT